MAASYKHWISLDVARLVWTSSKSFNRSWYLYSGSEDDKMKELSCECGNESEFIEETKIALEVCGGKDET
jgi:hypothetical protein